MVEFWIVQALGLLTIIFTILSFFQKEKWKMMLYLAVTNITMIPTYILCGSLLGGLLVFGALLKTIVYFYFSKSNKKPEPIIMIMFELYFIVISIIMWSSTVDLFMIINLIIITYTSWQDDVKTLRFGYIFSSLLLIPYDIILGAYTTAVSEIVMLSHVLYSLVKYSKVTKSSMNVAQRYFNANKNFWGSSVKIFKDFDFICSNKVDKSPFYNFGIIKNHENLLDTINQIKIECKQNNVKEVAYIPFNAKNYDKYASDAHMLQMFFPTEFNDVWMKLIDGFNLNNTKCKIQNVVYQEVQEDKINDIIEVYLKGYHAKSDINDLNENEKLQVENLKNINLTDIKDGFKITAYVAYYDNTPISLVVMLSNDIEAFITKVSTLPIFRRKHVASSLMQYGINKQRIKGIQEIMLVTDKYSTNEKFYLFNSFVEFGQAFALDVTDISKFKGFLDNHILE